jgi:hypothetical protein
MLSYLLGIKITFTENCVQFNADTEEGGYIRQRGIRSMELEKRKNKRRWMTEIATRVFRVF